jgi:hypothetical protein
MAACCAILEAAQAAITFNCVSFRTCYGIQFAVQPRNRNSIYSQPMRFDLICESNGIEQRLTKPNHPWTKGQAERMNRRIRGAMVKRFHHKNHDQL